MGSPAIFSGKRTKLLTSKGLLLSNGTVIDNDGFFNYFTNPSAEINATGFAAYADAAATSPVDGTGGSPNVTWTRTTSSPLAGDASFLFTKDAANRQGEGVSIDFTVRDCDKGKTRKFLFDYAIASGTYADNDMSIWFYDVTNSALLQPAPYLIKNHSLTSEEMQPVEVQIPYNCSSLRLILHVGSTSSLAYTVKFDNLFFGKIPGASGPFISDWKDWTPTGSWVSNTTYSGKWRQVGDTAEIVYQVATSGAPTSATLTLNFPSGMSIDTSKIVTDSLTDLLLGDEVNIYDGGTVYTGGVAYESTTSVRVVVRTVSGSYVNSWTSVNATTPFTFGASDGVYARITIPIVGWSSSQILSSDASTRVVAASYTCGSGQSLTSTGIIKFDTKLSDTHGSYDTATGIFTAKVPGIYKAGYFLTSINATTQATIQLRKNGASIVRASASPQYAGGTSIVNNNSVIIQNPVLIELKANDTIDVYNSVALGTGTLYASAVDNYLSIEMLSGPAQIAASNTVAARYYTTAGNSISNASLSILDLATKSFDYTSSVTTGASWKFTAPISGLYAVSGIILVTSGGGWASGEGISVGLYKNGSNNSMLCYYVAGSTHTNEIPLPFSTTFVRLLTGDYVDIRLYQNSGGAVTLNTSAENNYVNIARIGNY